MLSLCKTIITYNHLICQYRIIHDSGHAGTLPFIYEPRKYNLPEQNRRFCINLHFLRKIVSGKRKKHPYAQVFSEYKAEKLPLPRRRDRTAEHERRLHERKEAFGNPKAMVIK